MAYPNDTPQVSKSVCIYVIVSSRIKLEKACRQDSKIDIEKGNKTAVNINAKTTIIRNPFLLIIIYIYI